MKVKMQQLQGELKGIPKIPQNTPRNASLVPCSVNSQLNRVERLSVESKVLTCNIPEGNLRQHKGGSDLRVLSTVYVLNMQGIKKVPCIFNKTKYYTLETAIHPTDKSVVFLAGN